MKELKLEIVGEALTIEAAILLHDAGAVYKNCYKTGFTSAVYTVFFEVPKEFPDTPYPTFYSIDSVKLLAEQIAKSPAAKAEEAVAEEQDVEKPVQKAPKKRITTKS